MFVNENVELPWTSNLIVNSGRVWLTQRMGFDNGDAGFIACIKSIGVGTGTTAPALSQTALVTQTTRKSTTNTVAGTPDYYTKGSAIFSAAEINATTEVAIFTAHPSGGTMIARNTHTAINLPLGSTITFEYVLGINTAKNAVGWTLTAGKTNTYEIADSVNVGVVVEIDTGQGYKKVSGSGATAINNVESTAGSYYNDGTKTYIHASDNANMAAAVQPHTILILSAIT